MENCRKSFCISKSPTLSFLPQTVVSISTKVCYFLQVDVRYASIQENDMSVYVVISGFYISNVSTIRHYLRVLYLERKYYMSLSGFYISKASTIWHYLRILYLKRKYTIRHYLRILYLKRKYNTSLSCIPDKVFAWDRNSYLTHVTSPQKENFHVNSVCIGCIGRHVTLLLGWCHCDVTVTSF